MQDLLGKHKHKKKYISIGLLEEFHESDHFNAINNMSSINGR